MLELIDQVNPNRLIFRCTECQHTGISTHSRGLDGFFEAMLPDGRVQWQRHVCDPATLERLREAVERAATRDVGRAQEAAFAEAGEREVAEILDPAPPPRRRRARAAPKAVAPEPEAPKRRGHPKKVVTTPT